MPLDIGAGILISLFVSDLYGFEATPLFILLGIIFALLPDIDMLWYLLRKPTSHDHRVFTHYPLLYIPLTIFVYLIFGSIYGTLFALCIAMHLIHDTVGLGWGISWLAPFSLRKFRFLSPTGSTTGGWEFFRTWIPKEEFELVERQQDNSWVKNYYLRPNIIGFVEYGVCIGSIIVLYLYFH